MNPDNLLAQSCVIPAKAGIQQEKRLREADKAVMLARIRGRLFLYWIPAFAGMTD
jgi:hypothetical protein